MVVVGIDVGKSELFIHVNRAGGAGHPARTVLANTQEGHTALIEWLTGWKVPLEDTLVVMEATGVYWERVATTLHSVGYQVSVVNAAQIKFFAKSTLRRGKTDKMDAALIAQYGATMRPARWTPPDRSQEALRALIHERDAVVELIIVEKGRQHALDHRQHAHQVVTELGKARLELLEAQRIQLTEAITACVTDSMMLNRQVELLSSVPGIGALTAATVLSETAHLQDMHDSKQWAAYAGLSPVPRQSGAMMGRCRISKIGNGRLRRAFYLSAVTVTRLKNPLGEYYRRLVASGKPKKVALIALARKILRTCFAILRSGTPFDPVYQRPGHAA
jgi:transposase